MLHKLIPNPPPALSADLDLFCRLIFHVHPELGCWLFAGADELFDYETFIRGSGERVTAHVWIYRLLHPAMPLTGFVVDHRCEVKCCVNPDHLREETVAENVRLSKERARARRERELEVRGRDPEAG